MFLQRVLGHFSFCMNRNTFDVWKKLLEAARDIGKLSILLLGSPSSSMKVLSLLGWRGWWAMEADMRMRDTIGA